MFKFRFFISTVLFACSSFVSAAPLSGSCAMIATPPAPPLQPGQAASNVRYNIAAIFNFDTGTVSQNTISLSYTNANPPVVTTASTPNTKTDLTQQADSNLTGAYDIGFSGGNVQLMMIPVNGGNTLLVQGLSQPFSGVCQKL